MDLRKIHFADLLDICIDRRHNRYQQAWHEFERRYGPIIFGRIRNYLRRWNKANDLYCVEEISARIAQRLITNDFRAIRLFHARDKETRFVSYLSVICRNAAYTHIVSARVAEELSRDGSDHDEPIVELWQGANCEDIHNGVTNKLEIELSSSKKTIYHQERDILVYLLRYLAGFTAKEVASIPSLGLTKTNVENVTNRLTNLIKIARS